MPPNSSTDGVVFVLNRRFVPTELDGPYIYGVVQHALHLAILLEKRGVNVGFILYERDEEIPSPSLESCAVLGRFRAVTFAYNINMAPGTLEQALRRAAALVLSDARYPVLYYQTDVLLPFSPPEIRALVTHHSPFVDHVRQSIGDEGARLAFDWDHQKTDFLDFMQRRALERIKQDDNIVCLEISRIQEAYLGAAGVPASRIRRLPPPVGDSSPGHRVVSRAGASRDCTLVTAVSRFDHFKNLELFVDACGLALERGYVTNVVVVGGEKVDRRRGELEGRMRSHLRAKVQFIPRLARADLVGGLFARLANTGIFLCTSRYDLVPYTALEAACQNLCVMVPNSQLVGASEHIPPSFQFEPELRTLVAAIGELSHDRALLDSFSIVAQSIRDYTNDESVIAALLSACDLLV